MTIYDTKDKLNPSIGSLSSLSAATAEDFPLPLVRTVGKKIDPLPPPAGSERMSGETGRQGMKEPDERDPGSMFDAVVGGNAARVGLRGIESEGDMGS
jgi:hypothetical protein